MEIPNKLEEGQIWKYECGTTGNTEEHIVSADDAEDGYFTCLDGFAYGIGDLSDVESGWKLIGFVKCSDDVKLEEKNAPLTRKDKVFLLNGRIAHFSLSQLVEMTDVEVDEEFEKLQTVTNSLKAVARVLVNNGYWQDGIDFNYIESVLNFR